MEQPYFSRILNTRNRCNQIERHNYTIRSHRFKYDDHLQAVYCATPKVASTAWKLLFLRLGSHIGDISVDDFRNLDYNDIPNTHFDQNADETLAWFRLRNYMTFFITRHPFERLVSAFNDKLTSKTSVTSYRDRVGVMIAREQAGEHMQGLRYGTNIAYLPNWMVSKLPGIDRMNSTQKQQIMEYMRILRTGEVPFVQFVRYIIKEYNEGRGDELDVHWLPQVKLCHPCQLNYDYIMRFETLANDSSRLLEYLQWNRQEDSKIQFSVQKSATQTEDTKIAFEQISQNEIEILKEIYKEDFTLFGYNPDLYDVKPLAE
ncbi:carbohydrate sulfotransferase 11 isoform X2 [Ciona intestinalis]